MRRSLKQLVGAAIFAAVLWLPACGSEDETAQGLDGNLGPIPSGVPGTPGAPAMPTPTGTPPAAPPGSPDAGTDAGTDAGIDAGEPLPSAEDSCPGERLSVSLASPAVLEATTAGLVDDYMSYCGRGSGSGPDGVVAVEAQDTGTLQLTLTPLAASYDAVLYAQSGCGDRSRMFGCADSGPDASERLTLPVEAGQVVYAVADGRDGTAGPFELRAELSPPTCGDGVVNAGEACDRGDVVDGDGCDAACQFEPPADNSDQCPGEAVTLARGQSRTLTGHTLGYADSHRSSCPSLGGAPDRVFALNVAAAGRLQVALRSDFDAVLSVFEACDAGASGAAVSDVPNTLDAELLCSDEDLDGERETLALDVVVSKRYFVLVDGFGAQQSGPFELTLSLE